MSTDTISNMLSAIQNASMVSKEYVEIPYSKNNTAVAKVLKKGNFLAEVKTFKEKGVSHKGLRLTLIYDESGKPRIKNIKRVSKPGRRIYKGYKEIRSVISDFGIIVVSTPKGVISGNEAKKRQLGGEIVCEVS